MHKLGGEMLMVALEEQNIKLKSIQLVNGPVFSLDIGQTLLI